MPIIPIATTIVKGVNMSARADEINIKTKSPRWEVNSILLKTLPRSLESLSLCISVFTPTKSGEINNPKMEDNIIALKDVGLFFKKNT